MKKKPSRVTLSKYINVYNNELTTNMLFNILNTLIILIVI